MTGKGSTNERKEKQCSVLVSSGLGMGLKQVLSSCDDPGILILLPYLLQLQVCIA